MRSKNGLGGQPAADDGEPEVTERQAQQPDRSFIEKARRAQIIEAAVETIAVRGFAKASLAQIAARAGISKGVISYHFAGKSELMERLVEQIYEQIGAFLAPRLAQQPDGTAWLRVYIESLAEYMQDHRTQLAALAEVFTHFRTDDGELRYGIASSEALFAGLEEVFRAAQERGEFRAFDVRVMAVSLQAGVDNMFAYWSVHPDLDLAAYARELAELFAHATRADGSPQH